MYSFCCLVSWAGPSDIAHTDPTGSSPLDGWASETGCHRIHWESLAAFLPFAQKWGIPSQDAFLSMPCSGSAGILVGHAKPCFQQSGWLEPVLPAQKRLRLHISSPYTLPGSPRVCQTISGLWPEGQLQQASWSLKLGIASFPAARDLSQGIAHACQASCHGNVPL